MTERRIFEILLKSSNNQDFIFDFPKLQTEAADVAATKFTNIIYETLKQKSSASKIKRGDVLRYINNICEVRESHLSENSYTCFMKAVKRSLQSNIKGDLSELLSQINSELHSCVPDNLTNNMVTFYRRKYCKQKEKINCLEFIKKLDQEKLECKFNIQVRRNFNYYETNDNLIRDLLNKDCNSQLESNRGTVNSMEMAGYREQQIKFAYALINLKNENTVFILEQILQRISKYTPLEPIETNFIQYFWVLEDETYNNLKYIAVKLFPFLLERIILKYSTRIISFNEEVGLHDYFRTMEGDKQFIRIRRICTEDAVIYHKLKSLIYELYFYSFCNDNILKLIDFLI